MKTLPLALALCVALITSPANAKTTKLHYLDKASLESVILKLQHMQYPLTRAETLEKLGLTQRELPSLVSSEGDPLSNDLNPFTRMHELLNLTDPGKTGRKYSLLLWYDNAARTLGGDSFVKAKIINYVELMVEDDGSGDAPQARYILQSSRYPYIRLRYPEHTSVP